MNNQIKSITLACGTAALLFMSGNVLSQESNDFKIDTVNSSKATVSNVKLLKTDKGYVIKGEVRNNVKSRTPIPGHVDISIIGKDGKVINTTSVPIYRISRKSLIAKFSKKLKKSPTVGSTIRIAHNNAPMWR